MTKHIDNCKDGSIVLKNTGNDDVYKELSDVLKMLLDRDYASNTKDALFRDIREFVTWYETIGGERFSFGRVIERDVIDFRDGLRKSGRAVATVNRKLASVRVFLEAAQELEYITKNPSRKVKQLALQSLSPKGFSKQEIRKFLKELEIRGSLRDKTMVFLMLYSGLRVSEVVNLEGRDIFLSERSGYLNIRDSKGNKTRKVPLPLIARDALKEFLSKQFENTSEIPNLGRVFIGQRGPISEIAVNKTLEKYSKASGISVHPHGFRHTFAYSYLESNPSDIVGLSQILGHSDINTTAIYTQNRLEDLQERMENVEG